MKISCLTITQFSRINLLKRSLHSFSLQTFEPSLRELIIVHHDAPQFTFEIEKLLSEYKINAKIVDVAKAPLGELRNISIESASGDLLCQWDDDDFYHPDRLKIQAEPFEVNGCVATTLEMQMFWFCKDGDLYIRKGGKEGLHGSIMFRSDRGLLYQKNLSKGEDTFLIQEIMAQGPLSIYRIDGQPQLYVRTYHGENTWNSEHHYSHIRQSLSTDWLKTNKNVIKKWIKELNIAPVNVRSADNLIFSI